MFCPHCGAQNNDSATVCAQCGQSLKQTATASPLNDPVPPPFGEPNAPAQTTPPPGQPTPVSAAPAGALPRRDGKDGHTVVPAVGTDEDDDPEAIDTGATILLAIVAFIVPLLGIILYFVWRPSRPRTAQQMLMFGLVNIALLFVLYRYAQ